MAEFADHVEKLLSAWKALLPVIAVVAGTTFWFARTVYEREISTLKTEREGLRSENTDLKARSKSAAQPPIPPSGEAKSMMRLSIAAVLILVSSIAMAERKPVDEITSFVCELPAGQACKVKCSGAGGVLNESYKLLQIYQFAAHSTRLT